MTGCPETGSSGADECDTSRETLRLGESCELGGRMYECKLYEGRPQLFLDGAIQAKGLDGIIFDPNAKECKTYRFSD